MIHLDHTDTSLETASTAMHVLQAYYGQQNLSAPILEMSKITLCITSKQLLNNLATALNTIWTLGTKMKKMNRLENTSTILMQLKTTYSDLYIIIYIDGMLFVSKNYPSI